MIVALEAAEDLSELGGKAVGLGRASRAGLPVPHGYAVSARIVGRVAMADPVACAEVAALSDAIPGPLAARSSAIGEDSARASFAGQHLTCLGIASRSALVEAVRAVEASLRTPSALAYRARMGVEGEPRMGVIVQRVVAAQVAGVMFTRDPVGGADEIVIEASWGLGEVVVAGRVIPDRFRSSRTGVSLGRTLGHKDIALRLDGAGAIVESPIDGEGLSRPCLSDARVAALASLGRRCEDLLRAPADVEWAFEDDELFVLQIRPLTHAP